MAEREKHASAAKPMPEKSKYINTLNREALARYNKELELTDGDLKPLKAQRLITSSLMDLYKRLNAFTVQ